MKIGVFGDSFAQENSACLDTNWHTLLAKKLNAEVNSYGKNGTSIYYTYQEFKKYNQMYDLNVVLVTDPHRYIKLVPMSTGAVHIPYFNAIEKFYRGKAVTPRDHKTLDDLTGWYVSGDDEYNETVSDLMIDSMERMHSNTIFFPCDFDSLTPDRLNKYNMGMGRYLRSCVEEATRKFKLDLYAAGGMENSNVISGHLTPEYNAFFADVLYNYIVDGEWSWDIDEVVLQHPVEYYYNVGTI